MTRKSSRRELENMLRGIFACGGADCFIVDIRGSRKSPLKVSLKYGLDNGLLDREKELDDDTFFKDGMYIYRLTNKGREYFRFKV